MSAAPAIVSNQTSENRSGIKESDTSTRDFPELPEQKRQELPAFTRLQTYQPNTSLVKKLSQDTARRSSSAAGHSTASSKPAENAINTSSLEASTRSNLASQPSRSKETTKGLGAESEGGCWNGDFYVSKDIPPEVRRIRFASSPHLIEIFQVSLQLYPFFRKLRTAVMSCDLKGRNGLNGSPKTFAEEFEAPLRACAVAALQNGEYDERFLGHVTRIMPYSLNTVIKKTRKLVFGFHRGIIDQKRQFCTSKLQQHIQDAQVQHHQSR